MQYAWYQILGFGLMFGVATFVVFRGLDLVLEASLEWLRARRDRNANRGA